MRPDRARLQRAPVNRERRAALRCDAGFHSRVPPACEHRVPRQGEFGPTLRGQRSLVSCDRHGVRPARSPRSTTSSSSDPAPVVARWRRCSPTLGIRVTMLEAGPMLDPLQEFKEHQWPYDVAHRGAEPGGRRYFGRGKPFGYFTTTSGGWQLEGEPYTVADGSEFDWFRSRIVGADAPITTAASRCGSQTTTLKPVRSGRARRELAHRLRRHRTLLRQGRALHRCGRQSRGNSLGPRRRLPAPAAAQGPRASARGRLPGPWHSLHREPAGRADPVHQRSPGLSLLRAVWPWVSGRLELLGEPDADLPGDGDRTASCDRRGDGSGDRHRRKRAGPRGHLRRQADASRDSACGAGCWCSRPARASRRVSC